MFADKSGVVNVCPYLTIPILTLIIPFFCYFLPSPFSFLVLFSRLQVERETSSLPSAEAHQTSRNDRSAQFGSPDWRLEAVPVTLTASPSLRSSGIKKLQFTRGKRDDGIWRGEVEEGRMVTGEWEIKQDSLGDSYALSKQDPLEGSRRPGIAPSTTQAHSCS